MQVGEIADMCPIGRTLRVVHNLICHTQKKYWKSRETIYYGQPEIRFSGYNIDSRYISNEYGGF